MGKILVGCPIYFVMQYCFKEFIEAVKNIDYEDYDILLVDNSKDDIFEELYREEGIKILRDDTQEEKNKLRLISSRNKIIDYALENNYDYILMLDSDVIVPNNIIKELLKCDKDIVSGLYYNDFYVDKQVKFRPVCWRDISDEEFEDIKRQLNLPNIVKSAVDLKRFLTKEEAESGEVLNVKVASAGCMLINRKVFGEVRYGLLDVPDKYSTGDDIYFFAKARKKGFEIFCNTNVKCGHLTEGKYKKDSDGNLVNPLYL